jgi:hypothetical protein
MSLISLLVGGAFKSIEAIVHDFATAKISKDEALARIETAKQDTLARTETAWADTAAKQFESFQASVRTSVVLQRAIAALIITELMVLLFWQVGVPYIEFVGYSYPEPPIQIEWAYALLVATTGIAVTLRR